MSYTHDILTAMRENCIYRPCDLAAVTHLPTDEVRRVLNMLDRGGVGRGRRQERWLPPQEAVQDKAAGV